MSLLIHRWYDPAVGRWISEDPIGFAGGDANRTRYVANHPTIGTDPTGLFDPVTICVGIGVVIGLTFFSPNVANAPGDENDKTYSDTGPLGSNPENILIGAGVGYGVGRAIASSSSSGPPTTPNGPNPPDLRLPPDALQQLLDKQRRLLQDLNQAGHFGDDAQQAARNIEYLEHLLEK